MTAQLALLFSTLFCFLLSAAASPVAPQQYPRRTENGLHLPLTRRVERRAGGLTGAIGLGDFVDVTYSFLATIGGVETPLVLDTGSSDLWIASDACKDCAASSVPLFPQASFSPAGMDVRLLYGDSLTGTHAAGLIGTDDVSFAGLTIPKQYFAAINDTDTNVLATGCAGIFGLGFALNSVIWNQVFAATFNPSTSSPSPRAARRLVPNYATRFFPNLSNLLSPSSPKRDSTPDTAVLTRAVLASYAAEGPALTRMVATAALAAPMFVITLQRNTLDVGGNAGVLSLGELPAGVQASALTWAPVRGYPGALQAPADSPNEMYPIAWELFVDDVFLDGARLPRSNLSSSAIALSALVDTGNSLLRGPADVVAVLNARLGAGGTFPCATPHTLAFSIGGTLFPVDPRDFAAQQVEGSLDECVANVVETDAPVEGQGYQYSWSLGDPFLKGVLAAFHYGNITYPSVDPPRIGLLSTVPADAGTLLQSAIADAVKSNGGDVFSATTPAPTGVPVAPGSGTSGVPLAPPPVGKIGGDGGSGNSNAARPAIRASWVVVLVGAAVGLVGLV
ncbi:aspartic peptidase domain-containing protein [Mycena rosella]|uniref:Aspartic peptidase domain-containing protein n=1 Tax=Mycena rosella TaxID=1033263 RepID=A0AAD7DDU5_MYCRO|nr:aspartic peptidase domain-containing protein [Mycena rosella]